MNNFRNRLAGSLSIDELDKEVTLAGWVDHRRDHGGVIFIDLRDRSGIVQIVFRDEEIAAAAHSLRAEFCIQVTGKVEKRPAGNENSNLSSGAIEVNVNHFTVINESAPLPFQLDDPNVGEEVRLKYRYLDLRRAAASKILRLRSQVNEVARNILSKYDFVEIETPTLTHSTPEGARDFIVPARLKPGSFYALPQSPQLFKQLLMVGGMERYFQIARCYRDEDFRADRQPEFTQLDMELSFTNPAEVMQITEEILRNLWQLIGVTLPDTIQQMTYREAMDKYGSDKPDLRFDIPLVDCTKHFANTEFKVFQAEYVGAVVMPGGANQPRKVLDKWQEWAKQRGAKGLAYVLVDEQGDLQGPVAKNLADLEKTSLPTVVNAKPGDCIFFAAGNAKEAKQLLGAVRVEIANRLDLIDPNSWAFVWIVDFPLFEPSKEALASGEVVLGTGNWTTVHHAFTLPTTEWLDNFAEQPGEAKSTAYDIVCNGYEIGGGSMRIHNYDMQQKVFRLLGIDEATAEEQFGFFLTALRYGAPPHGGLALGWDRIMALLAGVNNIREVIAFPKTGGGIDPLTDAPAPISKQQRKESGIDIQLTESTVN